MTRPSDLKECQLLKEKFGTVPFLLNKYFNLSSLVNKINFFLFSSSLFFFSSSTYSVDNSPKIYRLTTNRDMTLPQRIVQASVLKTSQSEFLSSRISNIERQNFEIAKRRKQQINRYYYCKSVNEERKSTVPATSDKSKNGVL